MIPDDQSAHLPFMYSTLFKDRETDALTHTGYGTMTHQYRFFAP